ncbi:MAG TPA: GNAT family N-acetyltransferase [Propionibacteriaceae bacterium]|nr:GNAT family N-acetyltransferase [Propionibacteriaceae bacterium]
MMQVVSPAPRDAWRAVIAEDFEALPEQAPEWVDALCRVGPYADASRLYSFGDGRRFVLPLVRRTGVAGIGGWLMSYPPSWGIGGLVGVGSDLDTIRAVLSDLRSTGRQRISIRPDPRRFSQWSGAADSVTLVKRRGHVVDLTGGADAVMRRMHPSARQGIRVAERSGVRIEIDRSGELLEQYYRLYLLSVDRWADRQNEPPTLARWRARRRDPLSKLRTISEAMGKAFVVTMAYVENQPASGSITLLGQTAHYTRGAMDIGRVGKTRAGELVQWTMLQLACERGCTVFHMGESGDSESLARYKEKFGAHPLDYAEIKLERLPYTRIDQGARSLAKKVLGFRDA